MITGQKVVCIDDKAPESLKAFYTAWPKEGQVYTIRGSTVGISPNGEEGEICVWLVELKNPTSSKPPHMERGFREDRFRPLDELTEEEFAVFPETEAQLVTSEQ
jgi:hypothetical protein